MAIVYQHRRNDTNEVFYVGIGKDQYRAYSDRDRNKYWKNIVNKVGYIVQIVLEGVNYPEAFYTERYLIRYYGRKDLGLGLLVNVTDGGEGSPGVKRSAESIAKGIANTDYSFLRTPESISNRAEKKRISVIQYTKEGELVKEWDSIREATLGMGLSIKDSRIVGCCKGKVTSVSGFVWRYKDPYKWFAPSYTNLWYDKEYTTKKNSMFNKPVIQYSLDNEFIAEWPSIKSASDALNIDASYLSKCCRGDYKSGKGFIWKYNINNLHN